MKKNIWLLIGIIFLGGCLVRTYNMDKAKVDTDIRGKKGAATGKKPREITVMEIELGSHRPDKVNKDETSKEEIQENISDQSGIWEPQPSQEESEISSLPNDLNLTNEENAVTDGSYESYTVQENDTLQKISSKFYGTTKKWQLIYELNKDVLSSPDKVYPGLTLKIPR